ncbi:MAG TPA: hypothetical protein PLX18_11325 [Anaerohalosphaeraceae bacterium]|nr:hypothetical protein [Anaerohalosphaeraceae bacterium]HQG06823.1 hypothetical protein [Anaerohalosphaeraceae bacterium]HQI08432.1 hypothetical protein [Anaerohalosphaeraceae bacterium]HQJ68824.1 hypothetical protein [Anaerohalosphaeraceae bacterium]
MNKIPWSQKNLIGTIILSFFYTYNSFSLANGWPCGIPQDIVKTKHLFGNKEFPTVEVYKTCDPYIIENMCGCCVCEPFPGEPATFPIELEWANSTYSIDWGEQGPHVVVDRCGPVFPARGIITIKGTSKTITKEEQYECVYPPETNLDPIYYPVEATVYASDQHYFAAYFDPNVFKVNGATESPCLVGGEIIVSLVSSDCKTLEKALRASVTICHQKVQSSSVKNGDCNAEDSGCILPAKQELSNVSTVATVGVKFVTSDGLNGECSYPSSPSSSSLGGNAPGGRGQGSACSSGSCGNSNEEGGYNLSVGNASTSVGLALDRALSVYGSPDIRMRYGPYHIEYGSPEINAPGVWLRATHYPYQAVSINYTTVPANPQDGETITKVTYAFEVLTEGNRKYHYAYERTGSWMPEYAEHGNPSSGILKTSKKVALEDFLEKARGKVQLKYVTNHQGSRLLDFRYDSNGNLCEQISYEEYINEQDNVKNGHIVYEYNGSTLTRIWAGKYGEYTNPPTVGRWVDLSYISGSDGEFYLGAVTPGGCDSCLAPRQYEYGGLRGNQISKIKKMDGTLLASYVYDEKGNLAAYSVGDPLLGNVLKINEWQHGYFEPDDPNGTSGDNMLLRRDYVSNTQYRAKVYFADDNGALIKEIHYHQLQDSPEGWLTGPYSIYRYYHLRDEINGLRYITVFPNGNKLVKYYDNYGNVTKIQWDGATGAEAMYQYEEYSYGGDTRFLVRQETNAYGGITQYDYEKFQIKNLWEPSTDIGIGESYVRQVTTYTYDSEGRLVLERQYDANGNDVYTKYIYDVAGNLKETIEDYNEANPAQGLKTTYEYDEYNALVKTTGPSGKVHRKFYSTSGLLIAEADYDNDLADRAVSAVIYIYQNGKLHRKKTAKMNSPFTFNNVIAQAQGEGAEITWIQEEYEYDDYGRQTTVIVDAGGTSLRTEYTYNNQGEVIKILYPDRRYKRINRDGRGLVIEEITGVQIADEENPKATRKFFYDLNGNLIKDVDPEGVTEIYQYNNRNQRIRVRKGK